MFSSCRCSLNWNVPRPIKDRGRGQRMSCSVVMWEYLPYWHRLLTTYNSELETGEMKMKARLNGQYFLFFVRTFVAETEKKRPWRCQVYRRGEGREERVVCSVQWHREYSQEELWLMSKSLSSRRTWDVELPSMGSYKWLSFPVTARVYSCVQVCSKACSLQKQIRWNRELLKMDAVIKYLETLGKPGG